ncbi:MAG: hypothetical protein MZW92_46185 [Comamonadaceae bacterium]|nr:hypothetical protein [Comamonadaceae bacterium]
MSQFARDVLKRVHRQEIRNMAVDKDTLTLIKRARRLMVREPRSAG